MICGVPFSVAARYSRVGPLVVRSQAHLLGFFLFMARERAVGKMPSRLTQRTHRRGEHQRYGGE